MHKLFRTFLIAMTLLALLGVALLVHGAIRHANRPLTPATPGGSVLYIPNEIEGRHV